MSVVTTKPIHTIVLGMMTVLMMLMTTMPGCCSTTVHSLQFSNNYYNRLNVCVCLCVHACNAEADAAWSNVPACLCLTTCVVVKRETCFSEKPLYIRAHCCCLSVFLLSLPLGMCGIWLKRFYFV